MIMQGLHTVRTAESLPLPGEKTEELDLSFGTSSTQATWAACSQLPGASFPSDLALLALGGQPECGHLPASEKKQARDLGQTKKVAVPDNRT